VNLNFLKNKTILITGGTGSIGFALAYKLIKTECKVIRVMSNDENGLYELSRKLNLSLLNFDNFSKDMTKNKIRFFLGDVRDIKRCNEVTKNVDIVIHAAALKHVSIVEYNPKEAYQTNVLGTKNLIKSSIKNRVSKFLFISTDKVVSPTNVMGKTKLSAEKIISNEKKNFKNSNIKMSCIRFGNVLGSRGSVIPNFIYLLKNKKNITVTDPKMARFVMTLKDAVNSVLKSISLMKGREIFISKSMKCFKIYDLALVLRDYFINANKKRSKIIISTKGLGEKYEEELYTKKEIPFIQIKNNLFIITNKKVTQNQKQINLLKKYRVSNYNFVKKNKILKLLKKNKIIH
jgi:UDP-N-acetylglucosamine 4,6-dehydratase